MDEKLAEEFCFHNDVVTAFNNELLDGIFSRENIISPKKAITIGGDKHYGFFLEKGLERFFVHHEDIKHLPFKVTKSMEIDYRGDVYTAVQKIIPITIPAEEKLTFRELIDTLASFGHSRRIHYILMNIIGVVAWADRINARISTDPGFGKDSVVGILNGLVDSSANLYGATFAKLEYVLYNTLIVLNEMGNLSKDELISMQEFLLATGAYFNTYTKRTRKSHATQEQYDISDLSLLIFYNLPQDYISKAQEYFDQMFTRAVINRFIPFYFEGVLTTKFNTVIDAKAIMEYNQQIYRDVIATLHYYKENKPTDIRFKVDRSYITFPESLMRYHRTFNTILKYVALYAQDRKEFDELSKELYDCYKAYDKLIVTDKKEKKEELK